MKDVNGNQNVLKPTTFCCQTSPMNDLVLPLSTTHAHNRAIRKDEFLGSEEICGTREEILRFPMTKRSKDIRTMVTSEIFQVLGGKKSARSTLTDFITTI